LKEIRIAGFGGQGVILASHIVGRAVSLHEGGYATMTQNYGPEARGGAASAALVVSDQPVLFPYVTQLDILVVMAQEAYTKFSPTLKDDGMLLVEEDLVRLEGPAGHRKVYGIPATRIAEELGKKMVQNIVMVGFFCAITKTVGKEACLKTVEECVPERFKKLNVEAFEKGYQYGIDLLEKGPAKEDATEEVAVEN